MKILNTQKTFKFSNQGNKSTYKKETSRKWTISRCARRLFNEKFIFPAHKNAILLLRFPKILYDFLWRSWFLKGTSFWNLDSVQSRRGIHKISFGVLRFFKRNPHSSFPKTWQITQINFHEINKSILNES